MVVYATQILFLLNFFYSIWNGRKVTTQNPWGSNTLEWTAPIRPGHGNWPGEILKYIVGLMIMQKMATNL